MPKRPFAMVPLPAARSAKPRRAGLTMMLDPGLPPGGQADVLALAGDYVDLAKIKTGTARLYDEKILVMKLKRYRRHRVQPFLGGQFHEYVFATQGSKALPRFYAEALRVGFEAIEISDNVVPLTSPERRKQIRAAREAGLIVYGEVGSKDTLTNPKLLIAQAEDCFAAGAALVLVEAAEVVRRGRPHRATIDMIAKNLDLKRVMFELPGPWIPEVRSCDVEALKKLLIEALGPDVNLANVMPADLIDLETTRVGLGVAGPPKAA
ncbi:MAG TPA: phosphosulfolactate synthase [Burkholderiales bacterium]|nr:phosphosulfolactate synthase [Burkholderiales bacterium]